jgi:hypothetical protein
MCWFADKSPEWWAAFGTILAAVFTCVLAAVTVFQEDIKAWRFRPKLRLDVKSERPCAENNVLPDEDVIAGDDDIDVYYFRLKVVNEGNVEARDVQVYLKSLEQKDDAAGDYVRVAKFSPMRIVWAHYHTITLGILLPGMPWFCDFFHVSDPTKKSLTRGVPSGEERTNDAVMTLDLEVNDSLVLHHLPKGDYRASLMIGASNHKPMEAKVSVSFTGRWRDNEDQMFQEVVIKPL